ncbi:uncharacterized protein LOC119678211 isoform X5 [Teleopsis dalmanni]|uniref:uncharacterized protein LOC119678211 isoform X5 n=1 Tax=Teleopsis dalmanni TaxID=139649 RepID=UPI0018CF7DBC|nr:uncharacterized protein LOC119678211 isoform X5 [Teleopsis dalmanni]
MPFKKGKNVKQTKITDTMGIKTKKAQASPKLKQDINLQENVTDKKILEEKILGLKSIISNFDANNKETNEKVRNLPVSFETFKRLTFHNDVIANICQSIKELEYELPISNISKEELFDNNKLLRSYYKTFYMQTVIRTIFPLKIKPCPGRFKDKLLKYPEITSDHEAVADNAVEKSMIHQQNQKTPTLSPAHLKSKVLPFPNKNVGSDNDSTNSDENEEDIINVPVIKPIGNKTKLNQSLKSKAANENANQHVTNLQKETKTPESSPLINVFLQTRDTPDESKQKRQGPKASKSINRNNMFPVSIVEFKKYTYYKEVLLQILKEKAKGDEEIFAKLRSNKLVWKKALRLYYTNFFFKPSIRKKYTLRLKEMPQSLKAKFLEIPAKSTTVKEKKKCDKNHLKSDRESNYTYFDSYKPLSDEFLLMYISKKVSDVNKHPEILKRIKENKQPHKRQSGIEIISIETIVPPNIENEITLDEQSPVIPEENMEIFNKLFDPIPLKCTLSYVLRFSFGPKQSVLRTLMHISFEDFCKFTNIYQLSNIYNDKLKLFKIYESTIKKEIWPFNLYMRISDIFLYLLLNDVKLDLSDLQHISPKFLHWSDLAVNTDFNEIVQEDYFNMNGERIDGDEQLQISRESFYTRCWNEDDWIWKIPKITNNSIQEKINVTKALSDEDAEQLTVEKKNVKGSYISLKKYLNENLEYHNHTELVETSSSITNRSLKITDNASTIFQSTNNDGACSVDVLLSSQTQPQEDPVCMSYKANTSNPNNTEKKCDKNHLKSDRESNYTYFDSYKPLSDEFLLMYISKKVSDVNKHPEILKRIKENKQPHKRQSGIEIISIETIVPPNIENEITLDEQSPVIPEENMEIFNKLFDPIPLKCTLSYVLRFSFGPKQSVLRTLMHISFEDFCKFTNIYQLSNIYNDKLKLFKIYESTIKKEIWPFNLYMRISDIFLYLLLNDVKLDLSDLQHISPKFLHWSDLAVNTDFNEIVQEDYFNMNGERIDGDEQLQISRESFYTRCWNEDDWIWKIPKITNNSIQEKINVTKALSDEDAEQLTVEKKNVKGSYISLKKYLNENLEYHNHTELVETSSSITNRSLKITDNASTIFQSTNNDGACSVDVLLSSQTQPQEDPVCMSYKANTSNPNNTEKMSRDEDTTKRNVLSFINGPEPSIDRRFRPCPKNIFKASGDISKTSTIGEDRAMVYLRLRPVNSPSSSYKIAGMGNTLVVNPRLDQTTTSNNKAAMEKHFTFSAIFDNNDSQKGVYNKCIGDKIKLEGSFTVLTYGTSGSGKTFTLLGDDVNPGIVPRSIENIFTLYNSNINPHPAVKLQNARVVILEDELVAKEIISTRQVLTACGDITSVHKQFQQIICSDHNFETTVFDDVLVMIWVSFVEIYNEFVYDLLELSASNQTNTVPSRKNLKIVSNDGKVFVKGLTQVYVKNSLEALKLLRFGLQRVTYASTSINANSSRSHCIFIIDVLKYNASGLITEISYKFCDLAGSERLDKTGNVGSRLKETQRINTSLMILGRCLDAANNLNRKKNTEVIPYRESKLTMLLQAPLLGKEKIVMVVNVTPTEKYYEENLNVLGFSSIAKNIIFKPPIVKQNNLRFSFFLEPSKSGSAQNAYIEQLLEENILLRNDNDRLINEVNNFQIRINSELLRQEKEIRNELVDSFEKTLTATKEQAENRLKQELECQKRVFESKLAKVKRAHIEQIEDLREELQ